MGSRIRPPLLIVTGFWAYVAASNVLYANSMQANLTALHVAHFFAGWQPRLLQHLILYPVLLVCVRTSLRIGWQPLWRRLPLQILMALAFAMAASPALVLGEMILGDHVMHFGTSAGLSAMTLEWLTWVATGTEFLLAYGFALALVSGFDFYRRLRDSQIRSAALERALTAAHLASLRMQLSPHSLFNLLHTIRGQIEWDPDAARTMIVQLGDLLRRLLNAGEREYSRLADEVQFARLYLELQQRRFADRLTVEIPPAAGLAAAWVPSLILQPLVENAVVHGLAGHQEPVSIRLTAVPLREKLILRVTNTMAPARERHGGGIGLRNVRERLALQFGGDALFEAGAANAREWVAEIRLPFLGDVLDSAGTGSVAAAEACAEPL